MFYPLGRKALRLTPVRVIGVQSEMQRPSPALMPLWLLALLMPVGLVPIGCSDRRDEPWAVARQEPATPVSRPPKLPARPANSKARKFRPSQVGKTIETVEGETTNGRFGHTVSGAGDVNGDGFADILVGAFGAGNQAAGEVTLYYGSSSGIGKRSGWRFTCPVPAAEFGHQVEGVGDVNHDGLDDFVVGATYYSAPGHPGRTGGAFLFLGRTNGPQLTPDWQMVGEEPNSSTGFAVAAAGDVNGDGFADVLVGAWNESDPDRHEPARGRVALYLGGPAGLGKTPQWTPHGERVGSRYGYTLHGIGDVNGDGFDDVAVGSWGYEAEQLNAGRVYVYYGGPTGPTELPDWTVTGGVHDALMGNSVFGAGDVNGDGYGDLLVAANATSHPETGEGLVLVFHGGPQGLAMEPAWTFESNRETFFVGHSVATAGDLNGDGFDDVVISAFNGRQDQVDEGVAFVFHGSSRGLPRAPHWTVGGGQARGGYGSTVRPAGDVDGDGYDDLVVGHTYYSGLIPRQGRAWLHYGSAAGLAYSSGWHRGVEAAGFTYRSMTVPWPDRGWVLLAGVGTCAAFIWATRLYYRRRERRVLALQAARESAQREERQRLAQDLHDQLGAELTELVLAGANVRQMLPHATPAAAKLGQIESTAVRLVESLAEIVWLTKPTNDTLPHLAGYLGDMAASMLEKAGLACVLDIPPELPEWPVHYDLRHDLVLSVKEALHNAIKHADGTVVTFSARCSASNLTLEVRDNGKGFDLPVGGSPGNGLDNLRARLHKHGGTARVESVSPGTVVRLSVPVSTR
jgi:signal transduction histidine kinase